MIDDMQKNISKFDDKHIESYLNKILEKKAFDNAGLIYGMGHAVYSLSDPRVDVLRTFVKKLADEQGFEKEFEIYEAVEGHRKQQKHPEGRRAEYRLLYGVYLFDARSSEGTVYADIRGFPYRRLVCSQNRGTFKPRQNHTSRIRKRLQTRRVPPDGQTQIGN